MGERTTAWAVQGIVVGEWDPLSLRQLPLRGGAGNAGAPSMGCQYPWEHALEQPRELFVRIEVVDVDAEISR